MKAILKFVMLVGEYALGVLVALITVACILVSLVVALFEVPRYLRLSSK